MLGPRQQQIIAALADGPCSLAALERQAGVERGQLRDALKRLESAGLIQMVGKRGKRLDGVVVELSKAARSGRPLHRVSALERRERALQARLAMVPAALFRPHRRALGPNTL